MINFPNPVKEDFTAYSKDEIYQIIAEELPHLRKIAEKAAQIKQHQADYEGENIDPSLARELTEATKRWEECIGSQLDARNG